MRLLQQPSVRIGTVCDMKPLPRSKSGNTCYNASMRNLLCREARALVIVKHLTDALHFIHSKGVVHRDLKPENLLLDTTNDKTAVVKLADFGLSTQLTEGETHMGTVCGKSRAPPPTPLKLHCPLDHCRHQLPCTCIRLYRHLGIFRTRGAHQQAAVHQKS